MTTWHAALNAALSRLGERPATAAEAAAPHVDGATPAQAAAQIAAAREADIEAGKEGAR